MSLLEDEIVRGAVSCDRAPWKRYIEMLIAMPTLGYLRL